MSDDEVIHARVVGTGPPVLFLHGLAGSHRYWPESLDALAKDHTLVFPDLAGFGHSMWLPGPFGLHAQVARLRELMTRQSSGPPRLIVGHSFGALVAVYLAASYGDVADVVLFNPPLYSSTEQARGHIRNAGMMERWIADESPTAERLCKLMCRFRRFFRWLAPLMAPSLPAHVARDGVLHTWPAFRGAFEGLLRSDGLSLLRARRWRVSAVLGDVDRVCPPDVVGPLLADAGVEAIRLSGGHHLWLQAPAECLSVVEAILAPGNSGGEPQ